MFVIKNTKRDYSCYLSEDGKWKGLLSAKTFNEKEDADKALTDEGEVLSWNEVVGLSNEDK